MKKVKIIIEGGVATVVELPKGIKVEIVDNDVHQSRTVSKSDPQVKPLVASTNKKATSKKIKQEDRQ